jgi:hypothetical protein
VRSLLGAARYTLLRPSAAALHAVTVRTRAIVVVSGGSAAGVLLLLLSLGAVQETKRPSLPLMHTTVVVVIVVVRTGTVRVEVMVWFDVTVLVLAGSVVVLAGRTIVLFTVQVTVTGTSSVVV